MAVERMCEGWHPEDHPELAGLLRGLAEDSLGNAGDRALVREPADGP